ncbi:MAG: DUF4062 domain-containing protein, partial [Glutamicibacter arilaitensis]
MVQSPKAATPTKSSCNAASASAAAFGLMWSWSSTWKNGNSFPSFHNGSLSFFMGLRVWWVSLVRNGLAFLMCQFFNPLGFCLSVSFDWELDFRMNKREQVFVSSTFEDLKEARDTVIFGLLEADCFPAGMELFPASNASQWELIKSIID